MLLALDTSTPYVTACVYDDAGDGPGRLLASRDDAGPMQHGEQLAPALQAVLAGAGVARADLTALVVGVGPGPYTGLRVGVVTARTLGMVLGVPVHGVVTLDALALAAVDEGVPGEFLATGDARRKEVFWAPYDATGRRLDGPFVDRPADVPAGLVVGAGPALHPDAFPTSAGPRRALAVHLARVVAEGRGEVVAPEPVYLRRPDAVAPGRPKRVS